MLSSPSFAYKSGGRKNGGHPLACLKGDARGSLWVNKGGERGSPNYTPALPSLPPPTPCNITRVGGEWTRHRRWLERRGQVLIPGPSVPGSPAPVFTNVGEWGAKPQVLPWGSPTWRPELLISLISSAPFGSNSSVLRTPDIYCPPQMPSKMSIQQIFKVHILSAEP